jgi:hypothetical protein
VQVAQQHGHQVALGSIWAWSAFNRLPWLNAMYIWLRAYTGGIIMLQDRWVGGGSEKCGTWNLVCSIVGLGYRLWMQQAKTFPFVHTHTHTHTCSQACGANYLPAPQLCTLSQQLVHQTMHVLLRSNVFGIGGTLSVLVGILSQQRSA